MRTEQLSYFERVGEHRFRPTAHTGGAWTPDEQHFSPLGGLLTHEIDRFAAAHWTPDLVIARLTFDILGTVGLEEFDVHMEIIRSGRTVELLEATATALRGRPFVRARAWRLARGDTAAVAGGQPDRLPAPEEVEPQRLTSTWPGGYIESIEYRPIGRPEPGRGAAWLRTQLPLVAGEERTQPARFVGLLDTANGIAVRESPEEWFYPNVDLSVHFWRQPVGEWVGLDTTVTFGPGGQGLTSSVLHDEMGPVGREAQMLTIRRR